jgi:enoyl-CoA hydratase/carnithine racemase
MMISSTASVQVVVVGGVARIAINSPPVNALDERVVEDLHGAVRTCATDVRAVVITGTDRAFAVGADLEMFRGLIDAGDTAAYSAYLQRIRDTFDAIDRLPVPTLAVIAGDAVGGGLELALACDIRIVAEEARLGLPEVRLGLIPGAGGTARLAAAVGRSHSLRVMLTGSLLSASEALRLGLVSETAPRSELDDLVRRYEQQFLAGSPTAQAAVKRAVREGVLGGWERGMDMEQSLSVAAFESADAREGVDAFLQKRCASFDHRRAT